MNKHLLKRLEESKAPVVSVYEVKAAAAELRDNRIRGAAAVMGNLDRGGWFYRDVIAFGAFKKVLAGFKRDGFIADGHNWQDFSKLVATPVSAGERGAHLECEAEFHTTDYAQQVRQLIMERLDRGKSVGLSIGFSIAKAITFEDGEKCISWLEDNGHDLSAYDARTIKGHKDYVRLILEIGELFEFSIVTVPMNPAATATQVKSLDFPSLLGSLNELSFEDHSESVLTAVKEYATRAADYKATRNEHGRTLSEARRAEFEQLKMLLEELLAPEPGIGSDIETNRLAAMAESIRLNAPVLAG